MATATRERPTKTRQRKPSSATSNGNGATNLCGAKTTGPDAKGPTCRNPAGKGTDHVGTGTCFWHRGTTPTHQKAASTEIATQAVERLGIGTGRLHLEPAQALLDALWSACADVALYDRLLGEHEAGGGELYAALKHLTGELTGEAAKHVLVRMREDARRDQALFARECLKAKIAEQRVKLAQDLAQSISESHRSLLLALGISPAEPRAKQAMRSALLLVAGTG